jgi:hypothetical protein
MSGKNIFTVKFSNFVAITLLVLLASCNNETFKTPITENKFKEILIDIHLHEARLEQFKQLSDTSFYAMGEGYKKVYEKHNVTEKDFKETFRLYEEHPKQFEKLYEEVVNVLSEQEAKAKQ